MPSIQSRGEQQGIPNNRSSQTYLGTEVTVTQEQVADNGVTLALISMDGQEIGWIAKNGPHTRELR